MVALTGSFSSSKVLAVGKALRRRFLLFVRAHRRLLIPLLIVFFAKLVSSVFLYSSMNLGSGNSYWMIVNWDTEGQNAIIKSVAEQGMRWPYAFLGWDSAWYLAIIIKGYSFSSLSYAFFPGFPLFSWLIDLIVRNAALTMVVFSFVVGVAWVPIYQLIAENYQNESKASQSTLFFAFFPYVFLFTSVVYAEGLFLFSTLAAWYFFEKKRMLSAMIFASIATVSRAPGFIIVVPMLVKMIQSRRNGANLPRRDFVYFLVPSACLSAWYINLSFHGWFPPSNITGWSGLYSFRALVLDVLPQKGIQGLLTYFQDFPFSVAFVAFLIVVPILIFALAKTDRALAIYSVACFVGVLLFGGLASIPRFVSFIFPVWLPLTSRLFHVRHYRVITAAVVVVFWMVAVFLWFSFLNGVFVS